MKVLTRLVIISIISFHGIALSGQTDSVRVFVDGLNQAFLLPNGMLDSPVAFANLTPLPLNDIEYQANGPGHILLYYQVKPKETMFRIARRMFDMSIDTLMLLNGLDDYYLRIGQKLCIGYLDFGLIEPVWAMTTEVTLSKPDVVSDEGAISGQDPNSADVTSIAPHSSNYDSAMTFTTKSQGVAMWSKKSSDYDHCFALHRSARIDSYIEITNPMYGTTVLAKVIGRIPPRTYPDEVCVVLTPRAAEDLGAMDARFRVEMRFVE